MGRVFFFVGSLCLRGLGFLNFCWGGEFHFFFFSFFLFGGFSPPSFCFSVAFTGPEATGVVGVGAVSGVGVFFGVWFWGLTWGFGVFVGCAVCIGRGVFSCWGCVPVWVGVFVSLQISFQLLGHSPTVGGPYGRISRVRPL